MAEYLPEEAFDVDYKPPDFLPQVMLDMAPPHVHIPGPRKIEIVHDIELLKQVIGETDPFSQPASSKCWRTVADCLGWTCRELAGIQPRAAKERAKQILRQHRTGDDWKARQ